MPKICLEKSGICSVWDRHTPCDVVCQIRELESHKKIQTLLSLSGLVDNEVSYFIKEPPSKAIVRPKLPPKLQSATTTGTALSSDKQKSNHILFTIPLAFWVFFHFSV